MSSSLDKLVSNLPKESLKYTSEKLRGKKLDLMSQKGSILMISWIVSKNSIKQNCQLKTNFTAFWMMNIEQMKTILMLKVFGRNSN